jgi:hypothetical protein
MKLWKGAKSKAAPKKGKPKAQKSTPSIADLMDRTIAAQQAVQARNDWRKSIRANDAKAQALLHQHLFAQRNRW